MEAISLHKPLEVLLGQSALFKAVYASKSVMNIESVSSSQSLFAKLDGLLRLEVLSESSVKLLSSSFSEVVQLWDLFLMNVSGNSVLQCMRVVSVFGSESLTEVAIEQSGIVVAIESSGEVVDVVFMVVLVTLNEEGQNLRG